MNSYPVWYSVQLDTAYAVKLDDDGLPFVAGLVMYGKVDSTRLRHFEIRRLPLTFEEGAAKPPGLWRQSNPPSHKQIREAHGWESVSYFDPDSGRVRPGMWFHPAPGLEDDVATEALTRRDGESPDDFYRRVAKVYRALTPTSGRPTTEIARLADVPRSTAARWVRQARLRKFLPPTSQGRVS